jgi:hypothetical protein
MGARRGKCDLDKRQMRVDVAFCRELFARGDKRALSVVYPEIIRQSNKTAETAVNRV